MKGADLKCPTCGESAADVAPDFDLEPSFPVVMSSTAWTCKKGHRNMIDVSVTDDGETYVANEETIR